MSGTHRPRVSDVFEDPYWAAEDDKWYERMAGLGFSGRTQTSVMLVAVGMFALATVLVSVVLPDAVGTFFFHAFDGLSEVGRMGRP